MRITCDRLILDSEIDTACDVNGCVEGVIVRSSRLTLRWTF